MPCGVRHKDQNKPNKCHANLLAQGKPVPGWNDKPPEFKERLQKRADEIKEHGPWKDRPGRQNTGGGGGVNMMRFATRARARTDVRACACTRADVPRISATPRDAPDGARHAF